jgi:hypothetical protein
MAPENIVLAIVLLRPDCAVGDLRMRWGSWHVCLLSQLCNCVDNYLWVNTHPVGDRAGPISAVIQQLRGWRHVDVHISTPVELCRQYKLIFIKHKIIKI